MANQKSRGVQEDITNNKCGPASHRTASFRESLRLAFPASRRSGSDGTGPKALRRVPLLPVLAAEPRFENHCSTAYASASSPIRSRSRP
jgi:hypothetical protein